MTIENHFTLEKQRFVEKCIRCGLCAEVCPILPYTEIGAISPEEIQEDIYDFLSDGTPNNRAYTKAFACMACFKCATDTCPEELEPMLVNEVIKREYYSRGLAERAQLGDQQQPDSVHRVLASIQVSAADYRKISERSNKQRARCVFFPGCNVYFQPDKILSALDIMDAIGDDYAFLPGLDYCCGDGSFFCGDIEKGARQAESLIAAVSNFQPETLVLWCPTCLCRIPQTITRALDVPFEILSFPQYLAANMKKLRLSNAVEGTVTLQEACKSVYTGLDLDGPREVLMNLPGVELSDMANRGTCCGSWAIYCFPESGAQLRETRLQEAAQTGAEQVVTVCHYCNQTFAGEAHRFDFDITNYVSLVAEAMGIPREDKFQQYAFWGDLDRILKDANACILEAPFETERIIEVLRAVFVKSDE
jgi:Fe-S oxidoreductase